MVALPGDIEHGENPLPISCIIHLEDCNRGQALQLVQYISYPVHVLVASPIALPFRVRRGNLPPSQHHHFIKLRHYIAW
jgi:hypothetical protein